MSDGWLVAMHGEKGADAGAQLETHKISFYEMPKLLIPITKFCATYKQLTGNLFPWPPLLWWSKLSLLAYHHHHHPHHPKNEEHMCANIDEAMSEFM